MNSLKLILTLIILTANVAFCQDENLQQLIECGLIEQNQVEDFEEVLSSTNDRSPLVYLGVLYRVETKKLAPFKSMEPGTSFFINFGDKKPPAEQAKINDRLTQYLSKLKSCDLIDDKQFDQFKARIDKDDFVHQFLLLKEVFNQAVLTERMNPDKLRVFADKLKSHEIVTEQYDRLIEDIQQDKLQYPIDFLNYCNKAVIINTMDYPEEPDQYLEPIHRKTASVIPELSFTDFKFDVVVDSLDFDTESSDFIVSLESNGKKYKQVSFYRLYSPSKNRYYGDRIDQQTYYKIFNKILTDLRSPYRLHEVKVYRSDFAEPEIFGIIALTEEQADWFHGGGVYFSPSYESFKNEITSERIEQAIEEYKKIGLLSHLSAEQIEKAKERISEQDNWSLNDVLMAFPEVILMFDMELGNPEDPYAELVKEYKKISHNEFNPTEISDNFGNVNRDEKVELRFNIGDQLYTRTLDYYGDWIDGEFFSFIASVVSDQNLKGRFYQLYTGGQEASIIYLTPSQYEYVRTHNLLNFPERR